MIKIDVKAFETIGVANAKQLLGEPLKKMIRIQNKIDPVLLRELVNQIPEFSKNIKDLLAEAKDTIRQVMSNDEKKLELFYKQCEIVNQSLAKQLEDDSLDFEQKMEIIHEMKDILDRAERENNKSRKHIFDVLKEVFLPIAGGAALGFIGASIISNSSVNVIDYNDEDNVA